MDNGVQNSNIQEPSQNPTGQDTLILYDKYGFSAEKQFTNPQGETQLSIKVIRARELKWREMCNDWEKWIKHHRIKVIERCRKGIPDSMRCEAWQRLCNSPMVLVARPKVFSQPPAPTPKPSGLKEFFGSIGNRSSSRSLPSVITTSPSFRVRKKDKSRQQFLLRKLYANAAERFPVPPNGESHTGSPMFSTPRGQYFPSTTQTPPTLFKGASSGDRFVYASSSVPRNTHLSTSANGDSSDAPATDTHPDSLMYTDSEITVSRSDGPEIATFSTYTTTASVHEYTAVQTGFSTAPHTATTSGSGGYASLSTNSATDSASIRNLDMEPHARNFPDSCASSLHMSSFDSSSSVLWLKARSPDVASSSEQGDLAEGEDARATLMPPLEVDPVALYEQYCMQAGTPNNCEQIRKDINRQFPFHELFDKQGGHGQESLYTLLKAYTIRHSDKGYCQGQAPLAAVLLMFMPEVDAFWTFNEVCERYLVAYYDDGLERIQIDAQILYALLKSTYPAVYKHLSSNGIDALFIAVEWFMCVYTRTLPWETVLRVLDMFFCEGKVVLFRVAIVLLQRLFGTRALRKNYDSFEDIMCRLREVKDVVPNSSDFVKSMLRLELSPRDVAQEAIRQSHKWDRKKKLQMKSDGFVA